MNEIFYIVLFGIAAVFIIITVKKYSPEFALIASICAGFIILLLVFNKLDTVRKYVEKWQTHANINADWVKSIIKISVICVVGQWGIQLCRDSGENSVADKMELAIKVIVLIICFPYLDMLFDFAQRI